MSDYSKWFLDNCYELNSDTSLARRLSERCWNHQQSKIDTLERKLIWWIKVLVTLMKMLIGLLRILRRTKVVSSFTEGFKIGATFFGLVSFLALIPTMVWFVILSIVAWALNQSGLTGDWLHYWKYWWCLGVFILAFIGQVLVAIGGSK